MADRRVSHLRVVEGGNGRSSAPRELELTLAAAEAELDAGEEALASLRAQLRTRRSPAPSWPDLEDPKGFQQMLREHARQAARDGARERDVFGRDGWARALVEARVAKLIAAVGRRARDRREELTRTIASYETRADAQRQEAKAQDDRARQVDGVLAALDSEFERLDEEERRLTPGQRSGRLVGREAVAAGLAIGLTDAAAAVLTLNGVGGATWIRLVVASAVTLALTVAVLAAGRTLADLWLMLSNSTRRTRMVLVALTLGAVATAVAVSLTLAADPARLIWVGAISAFSATLALGWWHYSSEGDRLARRRRKLEGKRVALEGARRAAEQAAVTARRAVFEIVSEAQRARSDLDLLPDKIEALVEEQRAEGKVLLAVAAEGFAVGTQQRNAREREPTITARMELAIDKAIDGVLERGAAESIDDLGEID